MRSRTSWFNLALVRKNVLRGWPLWTAFTLLWIMILPMTIFSNARNYTGQAALDVTRDILKISTEVGPLIVMLYGILVAALLFSYLYKSRSVNTFGALPVRRETLFASAVVAGLLVYLVPMLLVTVITFFATLSVNQPLPLICLQPLAFNGLIYLFAFGLATLCAALVGNTLSLLGLYTIFNFTVIAVGYTVCTLLQNFLFGFRFDGGHMTDVFAPYSPLMQLSLYNLDVQWKNGYITSVAIDNWGYVLIIALVGLVCFAGSFLLFRRRHMERAGDVIAVKQLRPVFKYVFATGCAIVLGSIFSAMWSLEGFLATLLCTLLGGFLGYFVAEFMLKKSFAVWKKEWIGFGCFALAIVALMTFTYLDGWGYQGRVPTTDTVASVQLEDDGFSSEWAESLDDPAFITDVIAFHQAILHERYTPAWGDSYNYCNIRYTLFDGSIFQRTYKIPCDILGWDDDDLYGQYCDLFTDPYYLETTLLKDFDVTGPQDLAWVGIVYRDNDAETQPITLPPDQAYDFYVNAFLPDLREGNIGFDLEYKGQYDNIEKGFTRVQFSAFATLDGDTPMSTKEDGLAFDRPTADLSLTITPFATHILAALEDLGIEYYPTCEIQ